MKTHKDLDAWKSGMELAKLIYKLTATFPQSEIFGITYQMRKSAVSIPSNIAEGAARQTNKEFIQFLYIALASNAELETQLLLSNAIGYADNIEVLEEKIQTIGKLINGLIRYLKDQ
jgi:four helix bundle protein